MADGAEPADAEAVAFASGQAEGRKARPALAHRLHRLVVLLLQVVMGVELVALLTSGVWLTALLVVAVMGMTAAPYVYRERLPVRVPHFLQFVAVLFVFATLFLGEVRSFYLRVWWWDMALHLVSGMLVGMVGLMLAFILNGVARAERRFGPGFMALFVFSFALAVGALWEMFEFAVDVTLGTEMQRPMMSDGTGLTDTMWDMNLDAVGALVVALLARRWMMRGEPAIFGRWIEQMARKNPRLFRRGTRLVPRSPRRGLR